MDKIELVAANAIPLNTIGWMAPILRQGERCFALGTSPDRGFDASELEPFSKEGLLTLIEPIALEKAFPDCSAILEKSITEEAPGPFTLNYCVLYMAKQRIRALECALEPLRSSLGELCAATGVPLVPTKTNKDILVCAVTLAQLLALFRHLHEMIYGRIIGVLISQLGSSSLSSTLLKTIDTTALTLYQVAFDVYSAREAISLRTLTTSFSPGVDLNFQWAARVAEAWSLETSAEFWAERIKQLCHGLYVRHLFTSMERSPDQKKIARAPITEGVKIGQLYRIYEKGRITAGTSREGDRIDNPREY